MRTQRVVAGLFLGALLVACGGATATDLFGDVPGDDGGTSPTSTTTSTTPTTTTNPTTPPVPTPTTNPTTPPPVTDAGRDAADASRTDSGRDASAVGIQCGTSTCPSTDTCCAAFNATGGTYTFSCKAGAFTCPEPSTQINCDSAEDCGGTTRVCCGDRVTSGSSGYYDNVKCSVACIGNDVTFCNPASPTVSCGARPCQESTLLRGYYVCN